MYGYERLGNQRLQIPNVLVLMDLISNEDGDELGDSCKKQISMKCFLILGFTIRNAETILEMIDRFFNIYTDLGPVDKVKKKYLLYGKIYVIILP